MSAKRLPTSMILPSQSTINLTFFASALTTITIQVILRETTHAATTTTIATTTHIATTAATTTTVPTTTAAAPMLRQEVILIASGFGGSGFGGGAGGSWLNKLSWKEIFGIITLLAKALMGLYTLNDYQVIVEITELCTRLSN